MLLNGPQLIMAFSFVWTAQPFTEDLACTIQQCGHCRWTRGVTNNWSSWVWEAINTCSTSSKDLIWTRRACRRDTRPRLRLSIGARYYLPVVVITILVESNQWVNKLHCRATFLWWGKRSDWGNSEVFRRDHVKQPSLLIKLRIAAGTSWLE